MEMPRVPSRLSQEQEDANQYVADLIEKTSQEGTDNEEEEEDEWTNVVSFNSKLEKYK